MDVWCPNCQNQHKALKVNGIWAVGCPNAPPGAMYYSLPDVFAPMATVPVADLEHPLFDGHPDDAPGNDEEGAYWPDLLVPTTAPVAPMTKPPKKHWYEEDGGVA